MSTRVGETFYLELLFSTFSTTIKKNTVSILDHDIDSNKGDVNELERFHVCLKISLQVFLNQKIQLNYFIDNFIIIQGRDSI